MVKSDKKDVHIECYGNIRGCLVNHCNVAYGCNIRTLELEKDAEFTNEWYKKIKEGG